MWSESMKNSLGILGLVLKTRSVALAHRINFNSAKIEFRYDLEYACLMRNSANSETDKLMGFEWTDYPILIWNCKFEN